MIRVLYMSDLHIEMMMRRRSLTDFFRGRAAPQAGPALKDMLPPGLIVLAGDIHNGLLSVAYADSLAKRFEVPVVLVAGNHEYYYQNLPESHQLMARAAAATKGRVRFLDNEMFTLEQGGQRLHVLGSTLWTDFNLNQNAPQARAFAGKHMNDYRLINDGKARLHTETTLNRHFAARVWLHTSLARLCADEPYVPRLIVTHHAPGAAFLGNRQGAIGPAYASDLLPEFESYAPAFWVHGHTHYRHETYTHGFWVLSAPHGYAQERSLEDTPYQPGILEI
ncbi:MAG: metallophosphoesterase [Rhodospirillales bacterium]|nr:metallophosphoesterase [Rhodospirillales bacterium]MDE2318169.1 metallophosphoesterase [Rhodospirillales bacterium]